MTCPIPAKNKNILNVIEVFVCLSLIFKKNLNKREQKQTILSPHYGKISNNLMTKRYYQFQK